MADPLVLCLPSKGSLSDGVTRLFEQCLIPVRRTRGARSYEASIGGFDDVHVLLARATEIPSMLDAQQVHVGITGLDLVQEHVGEGASPIHIVMPDLGFGRADLVVGVPRTWLDVVTVTDLVEVADDVQNRAVFGEGLLGKVDEVRISDVARGADEFVFVPEPSSALLLGMGALALMRRGRARSGIR